MGFEFRHADFHNQPSILSIAFKVRRYAMPSNSTPAVRNGYLDSSEAMNSDLESEYASLREELERLMADPVKDFPKIDVLVDRLELLQLAIKEQHGIKGNNPNE